MPSTPRGRDAATATAVVLTVLLALVWLRSSGESAPSVPVGLPVETAPAAVETPARPAELGQGRHAEVEETGRASATERAGDPASRERHNVASRRREPVHDAVGLRRGERRAMGERSGRRRRADQADGDEDARTRRKPRAHARRGAAGEAGGQDPPAAAPAPQAGSGAADTAPVPASPARRAPEFAIG